MSLKTISVENRHELGFIPAVGAKAKNVASTISERATGLGGTATHFAIDGMLTGVDEGFRRFDQAVLLYDTARSIPSEVTSLALATGRHAMLMFLASDSLLASGWTLLTDRQRGERPVEFTASS